MVVAAPGRDVCASSGSEQAMMTLISQVNEEVSFLAVCRLVGMEVPDGLPAGGSVKVHCPFGFQHRDHGAEAAFRVYPDSNSGYCFAGCGFFSSVMLAATSWDCSHEEAARRLQDTFEVRGLDVGWEQAVQPVPPPAVDTAALAQALHSYCAREIPDWESVQFQPGPSEMLAKCLRLLGKVSSYEDAYKWLDVAKQAMKIKMGEGNGGA